jgi:hypothetical protein
LLPQQNRASSIFRQPPGEIRNLWNIRHGHSKNTYLESLRFYAVGTTLTLKCEWVRAKCKIYKSFFLPEL